jgi:hypothetical protein
VRSPPAFVDAIPPTVAESRAARSTPNTKPALTAARCTSPSVTPAPTDSRRSITSTSPTSCSRSVDNSTSSCSGTVPATNEVRPPCTVTNEPASRQARSTAATSSADPGRTSALARPR